LIEIRASVFFSRPSIAATAVSQCLYYLGGDDDAMEKVCNMSNQILQKVGASK
jgi:hypothetical protein